MVKYSARVHTAKDARACELNVYCEILGTRSYGGDARACELKTSKMMTLSVSLYGLH